MLEVSIITESTLINSESIRCNKIVRLSLESLHGRSGKCVMTNRTVNSEGSATEWKSCAQFW